jgi:hypothetical protein
MQSSLEEYCVLNNNNIIYFLPGMNLRCINKINKQVNKKYGKLVNLVHANPETSKLVTPPPVRSFNPVGTCKTHKIDCRTVIFNINTNNLL